MSGREAGVGVSGVECTRCKVFPGEREDNKKINRIEEEDEKKKKERE